MGASLDGEAKCNADMNHHQEEHLEFCFNTLEHNFPPQRIGDILTTGLSAQTTATEFEPGLCFSECLCVQVY